MIATTRAAGVCPHAPPDPMIVLGRLRPPYPARPDAHAHLFVIRRLPAPHALTARLVDHDAVLVFPAIVGRFFPGRWQARPAAARRSRRGLVRWVVTLIRAATLFPLLDEDMLDEADLEYGADDGDDGDGAAEELPPYCYYIPVEGGYPYEWTRAQEEPAPPGLPSEALLYVICGNPTRGEDEDAWGDVPPVHDARRRLNHYLASLADRRLVARVRRLIRAAAATSRRYSHNVGHPELLCGFDHALLVDLGGVFAGRAGPLGGIPTLATVMARSSGNPFIDVDGMDWVEMGYDQRYWSVEQVEDLILAGAEDRALTERAYAQTLHPLRADPALFRPLVDALEQTLRHYRAYAVAHGEPDPGAHPAPRPGERRRIARRRRRPR